MVEETNPKEDLIAGTVLPAGRRCHFLSNKAHELLASCLQRKAGDEEFVFLAEERWLEETVQF